MADSLERWLSAALLMGLATCSPPAGEAPRPEAPLEVEEVGLPVDAGLTVEGDVKGPPVVAGLGGVLPSDYPRDLPTYVPASIVGFGSDGKGGAHVEFDSPSPRKTVSRGLRRQLTDAGWRPSAGERAWVAEMADRRVRFTLTDLDVGTRIRVEYR